MRARTFLKNWLPPLAWVLLIFVASTDVMSAEHTSRFIAPFLRWLWPDIAPASISAVQFAVRKAAHVTEYAILAALLGRALVTRAGGLPFVRVVAVLSIASCSAAADEFHQSFVASRTGSPRDVLIDIGGALLGLALYYRWRRPSADRGGHSNRAQVLDA